MIFKRGDKMILQEDDAIPKKDTQELYQPDWMDDAYMMTQRNSGMARLESMIEDLQKEVEILNDKIDKITIDILRLENLSYLS
jgi:hypothetical protein